MRKIKLTQLLALTLLLGCMSKAQSSESTESISIQNYTHEYINASWNENEAAIITLYNSSADIRGSGAVFSGETLRISEAGTYLLSGLLENGQVIIDAGKNDEVRLVLNGVALHNETGPAIYAPKSKEIVLIIEVGTKNTVSSGAASSEQNAAIYVQDNLSITGGGLLAVTAAGHGIRAQDTLNIAGGVITVNSGADALRGRDAVVINGGAFTLEAGGDGIQSNNANSDSAGFIQISGGAFNIKSANDGIQAESVLAITGGVFQITTGSGANNAPVRVESFNRGGWGRQMPVQQTAEDSVSMKGLKAGKLVNITGGDITIDAQDDGVHSNDSVVISSGKLSIRTGDDAIHGDSTVIISGGNIDIPLSYEGIEGLSVIISGGNISVAARDDAINAADGSLSGGGRMGFGRPVNENIFVRISGGTLDLYAQHDGIDSNGNIFIEGGTIKISGPSQMMDGAIDFDGNMLVTGGEIITAGSVLGASQNSTQPILFVSYNRQQAFGSVIAIKDARGNTLLEYTSKTTFTYSGFTSPSFKNGETYSLFINGEKRVDVRLSGVISGISDSGGTYSAGRGGGGFGGAAPRR